MAAVYEFVIVSRVPNQLTSPTLTEVERLQPEQAVYTDVLNDVGTCDLTVSVGSLPPDVLDFLRDPFTYPSELRVRRDGVTAWAGPIVGVDVQDRQTVTVMAQSLAYYGAYMLVDADVTYTAVDQFTIAADLIADWQALDYGNYGIDTSAIGVSGVTRDRTYLLDEQVVVLEALRRLAEVEDGFDFRVDAASRQLLADSPQSGTDQTGSVILDARNIASAGIATSVAAGDVASDAYGLAVADDGSRRHTVQTNATVRSTFGRSAVAATFEGVRKQATLVGHTRSLRDARADALYVPRATANVGADLDPSAFSVGDTVLYDFDAGLGQLTLPRRVHTKSVVVAINGDESVSVELGEP